MLFFSLCSLSPTGSLFPPADRLCWATGFHSMASTERFSSFFLGAGGEKMWKRLDIIGDQTKFSYLTQQLVYKRAEFLSWFLWILPTVIWGFAAFPQFFLVNWIHFGLGFDLRPHRHLKTFLFLAFCRPNNQAANPENNNQINLQWK